MYVCEYNKTTARNKARMPKQKLIEKSCKQIDSNHLVALVRVATGNEINPVPAPVDDCTFRLLIRDRVLTEGASGTLKSFVS